MSACLGLSVVEVPNLISPLHQYINATKSLNVHCYICQRSCTLPLLMHVAIRASSVYIKSWTVHRSDLSSAPTVDFVDAAEFINVVDLISAAEFDIVLLCHSNTVSSSLGHSIVQTYHQPLLSILSTLLNLTLLLNSLMLSNSTLFTVSKPALFCQCTPDEFNPVTNLPHQKKSTSSSNQF